MAISLVEEQGRPRKVKIMVDGEEVKRVSGTIVPLPALQSILAKDDFFNALEQLEYKGALRYALFLLARQSLHSKKLAHSLRRHVLSPTCIERVLGYCKDNGWLNDEEWIEQRAKRLQSKGKSRAQVRASFNKDGIQAKDLPFDERAALERVVARKYPQLLEENCPYPQRMKALQALQRRGFSYETIQQFLQNKKTSMYGEV